VGHDLAQNDAVHPRVEGRNSRIEQRNVIRPATFRPYFSFNRLFYTSGNLAIQKLHTRSAVSQRIFARAQVQGLQS
jgi:hypothetical protein